MGGISMAEAVAFFQGYNLPRRVFAKLCSGCKLSEHERTSGFNLQGEDHQETFKTFNIKNDFTPEEDDEITLDLRIMCYPSRSHIPYIDKREEKHMMINLMMEKRIAWNKSLVI